MKTQTKKELSDQVTDLQIKLNELARCVIFTVNFGNFRGGCVMRKLPDGSMQMESWIAWFRRELAKNGVTWDDDLLDYGRANKKDRKMLLKERPGLAEKLAKAV
jgi:hypothetical protein